jgi:hypothetical protein
MNVHKNDELQFYTKLLTSTVSILVLFLIQSPMLNYVLTSGQDIVMYQF